MDFGFKWTLIFISSPLWDLKTEHIPFDDMGKNVPNVGCPLILNINYRAYGKAYVR